MLEEAIAIAGITRGPLWFPVSWLVRTASADERGLRPEFRNKDRQLRYNLPVAPEGDGCIELDRGNNEESGCRPWKHHCALLNRRSNAI